MFDAPDFGRVLPLSNHRRAPGPLGLEPDSWMTEWGDDEWWSEDEGVLPNLAARGVPLRAEEAPADPPDRGPAALPVEKPVEAAEELHECTPPWIRDRSGDKQTTNRQKKNKKTGKMYYVRPRGRHHHVDSIVLHMTAVHRRNANDVDNKSYSNVAAHFVITPKGDVILLHPLDRLVWHAQGLSRNSIGIEFEGSFPDIDGEWWSGSSAKDQLPAEQIAAGRDIICYLMGKSRPDFVDVEHIYAHRQSSKDRTNDPGPDVWYEVAEWAFREYRQLDAGPPRHKIQTGKPIPDEWRRWGELRTQ